MDENWVMFISKTISYTCWGWDVFGDLQENRFLIIVENTNLVFICVMIHTFIYNM